MLCLLQVKSKSGLFQNHMAHVGFSAIIALPIRLRFYALYKCTLD